MKKIVVFLIAVFSVIVLAQAQSYNDFLTTPVSQEDGDTIGTKQVSVSSTTITLIDAGPTNTPVGHPGRDYRKRTIHSTCGFVVYIGSSTVTTSTGFDLVGSSTAFTSRYETHSTAPIYGISQASSSNGSCVVTVIKETNSIP